MPKGVYNRNTATPHTSHPVPAWRKAAADRRRAATAARRAAPAPTPAPKRGKVIKVRPLPAPVEASTLTVIADYSKPLEGAVGEAISRLYVKASQLQGELHDINAAIAQLGKLYQADQDAVIKAAIPATDTGGPARGEEVTE